MLPKHFAVNRVVRMEAGNVSVKGCGLVANHNCGDGEVSNTDGLVGALCKGLTVCHNDIVFVYCYSTNIQINFNLIVKIFIFNNF